MLGKSCWITLKAEVSQVLLDRAFTQSIATGEKVKPWVGPIRAGCGSAHSPHWGAGHCAAWGYGRSSCVRPCLFA